MDAKLTISRPSYGEGKKKISISVKDTVSVTRFLSIEIDYDKFIECLTGLSETECDMVVRNLDRVGKKRETTSIVFEMPPKTYGDKDIAKELGIKNTPDGWICSNYYSSQNSFFKKDGKNYARTSCSRWVVNDKL